MKNVQSIVDHFLNSINNNISSISKEVPSFSNIYLNGELISEESNQVEEEKITHYHSEVLAIQNAQKKLNSKYLYKCNLITTLEPCLMCAGAIIKARIASVIYLLPLTKEKGISSIPLESIYSGNHFPKLELVRNDEFEKILKNFFKDKRKQKVINEINENKNESTQDPEEIEMDKQEEMKELQEKQRKRLKITWKLKDGKNC